MSDKTNNPCIECEGDQYGHYITFEVFMESIDSEVQRRLAFSIYDLPKRYNWENFFRGYYKHFKDWKDLRHTMKMAVGDFAEDYAYDFDMIQRPDCGEI